MIQRELFRSGSTVGVHIRCIVHNVPICRPTVLPSSTEKITYPKNPLVSTLSPVFLLELRDPDMRG